MARRPSAPRQEGPTPLFEFCVEGIARSARSKRRSQLREWQAKVAARAKATIARAPMVDGPVELHLTEFSEVRSKDRDNFAKPIQDALQGVMFKNDEQVLRLDIDWRDIDGLYKVRFMSEVVAAALIAGREFVWIRVYRHAPQRTLTP